MRPLHTVLVASLPASNNVTPQLKYALTMPVIQPDWTASNLQLASALPVTYKGHAREGVHANMIIVPC